MSDDLINEVVTIGKQTLMDAIYCRNKTIVKLMWLSKCGNVISVHLPRP